MNGSLQLGRIAGIRVQIHWTFWFLILFVVFVVLARGGNFEEILWSTAFILALFACIVFHEFGHALTARLYDIDTRSITLLPIGGVANLVELPEKPRVEFIVAIAGPAVNVVIAALIWLTVPLEGFLGQDPETLQEELGVISGQNFMFYLFTANVIIVVFNLLPAFPLDGGRMARALLSIKLGRVKATRAAAALGKFLAAVLFFIGLFYNFILALIAVFIYFGAESENMMVLQLSLLEGYKVKDAMITKFTVLKPDDTLEDMIENILKTTERDFVVAAENGVQGVVYMSDLSGSIRNLGRRASVKEIMHSNFTPLKAEDPLADAYREIRRGQKNFFPVLENHDLTGVVDTNNIEEFLKFRASIDE
ncbi:MAG: site-2 protease family protein [Balneolaceae bacterium]